jgi:hypothetical protein
MIFSSKRAENQIQRQNRNHKNKMKKIKRKNDPFVNKNKKTKKPRKISLPTEEETALQVYNGSTILALTPTEQEMRVVVREEEAQKLQNLCLEQLPYQLSNACYVDREPTQVILKTSITKEQKAKFDRLLDNINKAQKEYRDYSAEIRKEQRERKILADAEKEKGKKKGEKNKRRKKKVPVIDATNFSSAFLSQGDHGSAQTKRSLDRREKVIKRSGKK